MSALKEYTADLSAMKLLQILVCLVCTLLCLLCGKFLFRWAVLMWVIIAVLIAVTLSISFVCLPFYFSNLRYIITANQITVRTGIFFQQEQSIRLQSVQFIQLITGPWDGILGLNFIILYVYGGSMMIFFMKKKDRQELTDFLIQRGIFYAP